MRTGGVVEAGPGHTTSVSIGGNSGCVLLSTETAKCWGANSFGELGLGDTDPRGDTLGEIGEGLPNSLFPEVPE